MHVCCSSNALAKDFLDMIDSFNLTQHVYGSTHVHGHTLDLILTYELAIEIVKIHDLAISDHLPITCTVTIPGVIRNTV